MAAGMWFGGGGGGLEGHGPTDLQSAGAGRHRRRAGGVAVALARVGATRDGRPGERVELGGVKAQHVAGTDGDQLVRHQRQLLETQLGRSEERLPDERVVVQSVMMMMMRRRRTLNGATVESIHGPPNLHTCTFELTETTIYSRPCTGKL